MHFRAVPVVLSLLSVLTLAACATIPPPTVSPEAVRLWKVEQVKVTFDAPILSWPAAEERFLKTGPSPEIAQKLQSTPAGRVPEAQPFLQAAFSELMAKEIRNQMAGAGTVPVTVDVTVHLLDVPSVVRRVFVDQTAKMQATIVVTSARDGRVLASYAGPRATAMMVGGFLSGLADAITPHDPAVSLTIDYVRAWRRWLDGS